MTKPSILVTGAGGQLGSVLVSALRKKYGNDSVIATDLRPLEEDGPTEVLNVLDFPKVGSILKRANVQQIYHLAAILSAKGEEKPISTWKINMEGLLNVLEAARYSGVGKVFYPSSIAVFGGDTPKQDTPQYTHLAPETVYGISKEAGENWCQYYYKRYGVDVRSLRYPGLIGYESLPGGGTTDYAVEIFHEALRHNYYQCFLNKDTRLPMMYMHDAVRATLELMDAPAEQIKVRTSYNLAAMSFSPQEIGDEIRKHLPKFKMDYQPDHREQIARSWVESVDDSAAREDWGWKERFDLPKMVGEMLENLAVSGV
jgi:nucleoside-diphosphate-sugar epimerase